MECPQRQPWRKLRIRGKRTGIQGRCRTAAGQSPLAADAAAARPTALMSSSTTVGTARMPSLYRPVTAGHPSLAPCQPKAYWPSATPTPDLASLPPGAGCYSPTPVCRTLTATLTGYGSSSCTTRCGGTGATCSRSASATRWRTGGLAASPPCSGCVVVMRQGCTAAAAPTT